MEKFEEISKQMPYSESEEYLDSLVAKVTRQALESEASGRATENGFAGRRRIRPLWIGGAVAAAAAVLLFFILGRNSDNVTQDIGPIDKYLASISDEEAMQLSYYEIEEYSGEDSEDVAEANEEDSYEE
ncbi:MAG: hypothetical protein IK041_04895 [Bacteroidales bacterium]|nr:hypothetical protein [Bacteroidales bacterium]